MKRLIFALIVFTLVFVHCEKQTNPGIQKKDNNNQNLFETMSPSTTGVDFVNNIQEDENINYMHYGYIYNGAGVAAGDINNDGLPDLYFSSNLDFNKLYINQGNFKFRDVTSTAGVDGGQGYKSGVTMADINNDGWLDIFVCKTAIRDTSYRHKMLYINNHDGTFTERAGEYGLDDLCYSTQAYFFDSDLDGDLDVYFVNHPMNFADNNYIRPTIATVSGHKNDPENDFISDRFYENRNGHYVDMTDIAGIRNEAFGLSAVVADFTEDGLPDIYVANDFLQPDYLYVNLGKNRFKENFDAYFDHCSFSSMGTDFADINNDGCSDLIVVDMTPSGRARQNLLQMTQNYDRYQLMLKSGLKAQFSINSLQMGSCGERFSDIAFYSGIAYTDWSWTPLFADFNNDGYKDLFVTNGYLHDVMNNDYNRYKLDSLEKLHTAGRISQVEWINQIPSVKVRDFLFENKGGLKFIDRTMEWNSGPATFSHGACYADLDNDGDLDLIISNVNDPATLLRNRSREQNANHFIRFVLEDPQHRSMEGTAIRLMNEGHVSQIQNYRQTRGFLSRCEDALHFGLGKTTTIDYAEISWPDGTIQTVAHPLIDGTIKISRSGSRREGHSKNKSLMTEIALPSAMSHRESEFIDYKKEILLIDALSTNGPAIASADINQDGLDDVYLGGSNGNASSLWLQDKNESFHAADIRIINSNTNREVTDALLVDINGDKLPDLYEVCGSNEGKDDAFYQDRLWINKGSGHFQKADYLPSENLSGSCICSADIDGDGDMDLFVGSGPIPGRYPSCTGHMLLINNGGRFENKIEQMIPSLQSQALTDATFGDLDGDGHPELIVCGEFSPIRIFSFTGGKANEMTSSYGLEQCLGMWKSIQIADLNGDQFPDIIAGNYGLNSHLKADDAHPLEIFCGDFDKNGSLDAVLCQYEQDKIYPLLYRDRLLDQMVFLKKKFTRFEPYANSTLQEVFTPEQLSSATHYKANDLASKVLISEQGKHFRMVDLPPCSQLSFVTGSAKVYIKERNKNYVLTVGNSYNTDAQFGRHDSSHGCLCEIQKDENFNQSPTSTISLNLAGDIRKVVPLHTSSGTKYLIGRNNGPCTLLTETK